ncbi:SURF1 family protein [Lysobacter cavernae]|uniref:SURF1-like protein n=1 Tax=Lysobacter cavernae TaxID=1685901 RepID=A0ABV7RTU4_9GAMM
MSRRSSLIIGWIAATLAIALFVHLGLWQSRRAVEKQAMLDAAAQVLETRTPKPLAVASDPRRARAYDWSAGAGSFEEDGAWLLDNQLRNGRAGVRVYRVFHPGRAVPSLQEGRLLVDLGWVPLSGDRRMPALEPAPSGIVEVRGLLAPPPSGGLAMGPAFRQEGAHRLMTRLDTRQMSAELGLAVPLAPRVLRLDPALPSGYQRDLELLPNTLPPDKHRGYAVQWFGLALTVLATALILTFRKPRRRP